MQTQLPSFDMEPTIPFSSNSSVPSIETTLNDTTSAAHSQHNPLTNSSTPSNTSNFPLVESPPCNQIVSSLPFAATDSPATMATHSSPPRRSSPPTKTLTFLQDFHVEAALPSRPASSSSPNTSTAHSLSHVLSYD